jgi:hypothetical protein
MKKLRFFVLFLIALGLFFSPIFGEEKEQQKLKNWEFIPNISASGDQNHIALNSELISANRLFLNKKKTFFLFGQFGVMYNLFENQINDEKFNEWQLGFEPLLGFGTKHIRFSGFLNSLNLKMMDTGKFTFTEAGIRFTLVPFKKIRVKGFITQPISDPRLIGDPIIEEIEYENEEGVFLQKKTTFKFARQEKSFGGNLDLGIGKKIIFGLKGFARNKENYQLGGKLQYKISKKKPWVISANAYYTDFQEKNYLYIHNVFPGMFDERMQGWTAKIGISNVGGVGNIDFTNFQSRFAEELYFSPVIWYYNYVNSEPRKISDPYKIEGCDVDNGCLDWTGFVCQSGGKTGYDDLIDYGDGTNERRENVGSGSMRLSHHYQHPGIYLIIVSGKDALGVIRTFSKQITIKDCSEPKKYKLIVELCADGVTGNPITGTYYYDAGATVNYSYKLKDGYKNLIITIDGLSKSASGKIIMDKDHYLKACYSSCISTEILEFGVKPTTIEYNGSATFYWRVRNWKTLFLSGENVANFTHLESGDIWYGEKTFSNLTSNISKELIAKNDCPSIASASATVTVKQCDKCGDTGIHDDGGSDTKNWNNIEEGNFSKELTVYNVGYCNWPNFLIKAKVEEQQGSALRARNETTINLPARSQVTITISYNNTTRTISFSIGSIVPLSNAVSMSLDNLPGFNDISLGKKVILVNNEGFGTIQCVYLKMQFATECGASF